jgi:hypothetical protein
MAQRVGERFGHVCGERLLKILFGTCLRDGRVQGRDRR